MQLESYTVGLLFRQENAPPLSEQEEAALQDAHMDHLARLHDQGILMAAGPVLGAADRALRGLAIYAVDAAAAQQAADHDPAVQAGRYRHEFHPWLVPSDVLQFGSSPLPRSMAEVTE